MLEFFEECVNGIVDISSNILDGWCLNTREVNDQKSAIITLFNSFALN